MTPRRSYVGFHSGALLGTLAVALLCVIGVQIVPLRTDAFGTDSADRRAAMDGLAASDLAELKLRHAEQTPRYDVGLFGNSRILAVAADDVGLAGKRVFNFALSGQSIRQSIVFLEEMAAVARAPYVAIFSFDNLELQFFANPVFPGLPSRTRLGLDDLTLTATIPALTARDRVRIAWRYGFGEWTLLRSLFSATRLRNRLAYLFPDPAPTAKYRADGSRADVTSPGESEPAILTAAGKPGIIPGILGNDLKRLARLRDAGLRVIVYESPLEPRSAAHFDLHPSSYVAEHRAYFLEACGRLRLECHVAARLDEGRWDDATHPPPAVLGRYINSLVQAPPRVQSAANPG